MKKMVALFLAFSMMFALTACQNDKKEAAMETQEELAGGNALMEEPSEFDSSVIGTVTMEDLRFAPPVILPETTPNLNAGDHIPEDAQGYDLKEIYQDFLDDYDWSQYNGFTSRTYEELFTYVWTSDAQIYDVQQMSQAYDDTIRARWTNYYGDDVFLSFEMTESGCFSETREREGFRTPEMKWRIVNENTVYEYNSTITSGLIYDMYDMEDTTYDIIAFTTEWDGEGNTPIFATEETVLRGELYINRSTQRIDYMKDKTHNFFVTFLTDAAIAPRIPANTLTSFPGDVAINHWASIFAPTVTVYLQVIE